ncbi:response regulator [Limisalsivibrio acetivorans]|uniref:response regulator n=1 Tax=Limisalsivibrio acetivorans TaxID=1304888 RepID=UPI0003B36283|nr:response regulator [Limisalsivibrio acetivorans]
MIRVMIIEDDRNIASLHSKFTEKVEGFTPAGIANSLEEAEEMAEILEPDLVLLDLFLPDGSGMEFLRGIRSKGIEADVILITAAKDVKSLQSAMRGGAFDYIVKPVIFERFKQSLNRYRDYTAELEKSATLEQGDIDHILDRHSENSIQDLPKGIYPITLKKITAVFDNGKDGLSAEEAGELIGASRNTARRYLEYLSETGFLYADIDYGAVGRPEKKFYRHN